MKKFIWRQLPTGILWASFFALLFVLLAMYTGLNTLLVKPLVHNETPKKADVIIVLGGGVMKTTKTLPWGVEERVKKGAELYRAGYAGEMIVSGGLVAIHSYTEAEVMEPYAVQLGVPVKNVFEEDRSSDTHTNAIYSERVMDQHSWRTALLVTSDFHTQRACHVFRKQQITVICVAAYKDPSFKGNVYRNLLDLRSIAREYVATVYYWMKGWI